MCLLFVILKEAVPTKLGNLYLNYIFFSSWEVLPNLWYISCMCIQVDGHHVWSRLNACASGSHKKCFSLTDSNEFHILWWIHDETWLTPGYIPNKMWLYERGHPTLSILKLNSSHLLVSFGLSVTCSDSADTSRPIYDNLCHLTSATVDLLFCQH